MIVRVGDGQIEVESIECNPDDIVLNAGESLTLETTIVPKDASDQTLLWTSSDESVVSVQDGVIYAHKSGNAAIKVMTSNGKWDTCNVNVIVDIESIEVKKDQYMINISDTFKIEAILKPDNITVDKDICYSSNNEDVVIVDNDGTVVAKNSVKAIISITAGKVSKDIEIVVEEQKSLDNTMIIKEDTVLNDVEIDSYVYVEKGCTLTIQGDVVFNKNIYVFGSLVNEGYLQYKCEKPTPLGVG